MRNIVLASTSSLLGQTYLSYLKSELIELYKDAKEIIFIPFARPGGISHDEYTEKASIFFASINKKLRGLHEFSSALDAIKNAQGFFTGGGNTFLLVKQLHGQKLMNILRDEVLQGKPYLGCSAGANIGGINMQTTNDMPIVYPSSFETMSLVNFNINPHFLDAAAQSTHMGETRETRIKEFLTQNQIPVIGLREGSWLRVKNNVVKLEGKFSAKIFENAKAPYELPTHSEIVF